MKTILFFGQKEKHNRFYSHRQIALGLAKQSILQTFAAPDLDRFPMLRLAYKAASSNGGYTIAYNAANEVAVAAFAQGKIGFYGISDLTENVLSHDWTAEPTDFDDVMSIDGNARKLAQEKLA